MQTVNGLKKLLNSSVLEMCFAYVKQGIIEGEDLKSRTSFVNLGLCGLLSGFCIIFVMMTER